MMPRDPADVRILIGCETSGVVRRAFDARGFDVWSCDLLPADDRSNRHIQEDVRVVIEEYGPWDMLAVMHPPCTRLCNSGVRWLHTPPPGRTREAMWAELDEGAALFSDCWNADIPRVCVENPVMHKYARERIENYVRPHIVQPYEHGDAATKATGLHLRGLPPLAPTEVVAPPERGTDAWKAWTAVHRAPPGPGRWKFRSQTFPGIARSMASQWGDVILEQPAAA